jgi:zinc/manganese transport system substrate-binding protein
MSRRSRLLGVGCLLLGLMARAPSAPALAQTSTCTIQGGFATIAAAIPNQVGQCIDNATTRQATGDMVQHTLGGVFVYRAADNSTSFSDGSTTWLIDPSGNVVNRPANQAFSWEFNPDGYPVVGSTGPTADGPCPGSTIQAVAVENQWASVLQQLGGQCVSVTTIITDPFADPHEYEPTSADSLAYQTAGLVVENGAGYDDFSDKITSTVRPQPMVVNAGNLVGKKAGDNPHVWYSPSYVDTVSNAITQTLKQLRPDNGGYFDTQAAAFASRESTYHSMVQQIAQKFPQQPVGSTESIFVFMAQATNLTLISPPGFMDAISEGNDPVAQDVATFQNQIDQKQIKVLVYNDQTITNLTDQLKAMAKSNNIPIVGVSETMPPEDTTFQGWQAAQLLELSQALAAATGQP